MNARKSHVIVGTPKEIVAYRLMRLFDIEKIVLCILDDADAINTTKLIQQHILHQLQGQLIMLSSYRFKLGPVTNCHRMEYLAPLNCIQYYLNVNDVCEKVEAIVEVYNVLVRTNTKGIIFCKVSTTK